MSENGASGNGWSLSQRPAELRREFDAGFAVPARVDERSRVELLLVRVGPDQHAIRLSEIRGLHSDRLITPVPGPLPELLGLVSLRGVIVPVYDLRLLLGYSTGMTPRWLVLAMPGPVGLAFEHLEGHAVVAPRDIVTESNGAPGQQAAREVVVGPDGRAALLHVASLVNEIAARARRARKER